ncbi:MAG: methyltransferase domain-containing protein [Acidimicrobiia bacterium]
MHPDYPRTSAYDPKWVFLNHMGPNVVWLTEWLTQVLDLQPGMRVLDLGCGTAISSIFLAREFGVQVWASDLWISPDDNARRIAETDVADRVLPISVEAHTLPYAAGYFDAIVSVDAFHYFDHGLDRRRLLHLPQRRLVEEALGDERRRRGRTRGHASGRMGPLVPVVRGGGGMEGHRGARGGRRRSAPH